MYFGETAFLSTSTTFLAVFRGLQAKMNVPIWLSIKIFLNPNFEPGAKSLPDFVTQMGKITRIW